MMCDWGRVDGDSRKEGNRFGRNSVGEEFVRRLQKAGATERACAIAVWHLDIKLAIEILNLSLRSKSICWSSISLFGFICLNNKFVLKCLYSTCKANEWLRVFH